MDTATDPTRIDAVAVGGEMILATHPSYPASRAYVLKLHRDARPRQGRYIGRLENVSSGEQFVFGSAEELLACLARDVRRLKPE